MGPTPVERDTMNEGDSKIAVLDPAGLAARREFLGWQCRIRQLAVRQSDGRPSTGMRPAGPLLPGGEDLGPVIVLIRRKASDDVTAQFQHMVRRTRDPAERRDSALKFMAAAYYQRPDEFSDELTALFGPDSALARRLVDAGRCRLDFAQFGQRYVLECRVRRLAETDPGIAFTYWHACLFNPAIPGDAEILAFQPDWAAQNLP